MTGPADRPTGPAPAQSLSLAAAAALAAATVVLGLRFAGTLEGIELALYDRALAGIAVAGPAPDVVAIPIAESDLAAWGWPVPDTRLADLARRALDAGAVAVGIDVYRDRPVPPGSAELDLVLADPRVTAIYKFSTGDADPGVAAPAAGAERAGFADVPLDPDGAVRRGLLVIADQSGAHQSLALRLAGQALSATRLRGHEDRPDVLMIGAAPVPRLDRDFGPYSRLDSKGYQIALNLRHPPGSVPVVPAGALAAGLADPAELAGRVAVIGIAGPSVKDSFRTPGHGAGTDSAQGIGVQAAIVQHLIGLGRGETRPLAGTPALVTAALTVAAALGGALAGLAARSGVALLALGPGASLALCAALNAGPGFGRWLPALPPALGWLLAFLAVSSVLALVARRRQVLLDRLFTTHLSPALAREVWQNRDILLSGGRPVPRRLFATVLFADLAGSTRVGGTADPAAFMDWIGTCLARLGEAAQAGGGFVEKYTGDGIMVVFGAPVPSESPSEQARDAARACAAALAMGEAVRALNAARPALSDYRIRIGIHSGPVFGGTIGVAGSLRYNIIGDTANFAARVEAFGKRFPDAGTRAVTICVTEDTARLAGDAVGLSPAGRLVHDDGRHEAEIFELTGLPGTGVQEESDDRTQDA
ncbi:MAG: CHASE2 domain-containing protein [Paracoccaceae bacterium]